MPSVRAQWHAVEHALGCCVICWRSDCTWCAHLELSGAGVGSAGVGVVIVRVAVARECTSLKPKPWLPEQPRHLSNRTSAQRQCRFVSADPIGDQEGIFPFEISERFPSNRLQCTRSFSCCRCLASPRTSCCSPGAPTPFTLASPPPPPLPRPTSWTLHSVMCSLAV